MVSSALSKRRLHLPRPKYCLPSPPTPAPAAPEAECWVNPPEFDTGPGGDIMFNLYGCTSDPPETTIEVYLYPEAGSCDPDHLTITNCTPEIDAVRWTLPGETGDYLCTVVFIWPGYTVCEATSLAHVLPEE